MVNLKLMQPQEIEVLYILPAIRRELAKEMKKEGMEQKKIAGILCVTEAAISQYMKDKRACKVTFCPESLKAIKSAAKVITDKNNMVTETQKLLKLMRKLRITCDLHRDLAEIPDDCKLCP